MQKDYEGLIDRLQKATNEGHLSWLDGKAGVGKISVTAVIPAEPTRIASGETEVRVTITCYDDDRYHREMPEFTVMLKDPYFKFEEVFPHGSKQWSKIEQLFLSALGKTGYQATLKSFIEIFSNRIDRLSQPKPVQKRMGKKGTKA